MRKHILILGLSGALATAAPLAVIATSASSTGCTQAQWQSFQTNATAFVQYAQTFLQTVMTVWSTISPLLGANLPADQKIFNDAHVACTSAIGVFIDGVQAAIAANTLNLPALMAPVQDACAKLLAVIAQFQMTATGAGIDPNSVLQVQATKIWNWK
jgi:hypothetical protein